MMLPLISIITPTFHAAGTLRETLESISAQDLEGTEHLLIDGDSRDSTLQIAECFSGTKVFSERDDGIYDAMNKGAMRATGEWLLFVQADDWLPAGTIAAYKEALTKTTTADFLCGGAEAVKRSGLDWTTLWSVTDSDSIKLTVENIALGEPMINARLMRRALFLKLGGFSLEYALASDRDFLLRAAKARVLQEEIPVLTYRYRWHEGSRTMTHGNALTTRLSAENLEISKVHLASADQADRKALRRWHSKLTVQAAMNALETRGWRGLPSAAMEGTRINPAWPALFLGEIVRSLPGFLVRGGKTRSGILRENV